MWGSLPFKNPLYHGNIRGDIRGISGGNVLGWLEAAVEELVSHLMSLFAVAMNLPAARPGSIWTILDLGISVSVVFGDVDICRAA